MRTPARPARARRIPPAWPRPGADAPAHKPAPLAPYTPATRKSTPPARHQSFVCASQERLLVLLRPSAADYVDSAMLANSPILRSSDHARSPDLPISHALAYFQLTYAAWVISTSRPSRPSSSPPRKK